MRLKIFFFALLLTVSYQFSNAQEIARNEVDEFTGDKIRSTSWELFGFNMKPYSSSCLRFSQVNERYYLDLKLIIDGKVFSINKGNEFILILDNDEKIKLENLEFTVTCTGCGAKGFVGSAAMGTKLDIEFQKKTLKN